jgi:type I restriction enzyme, R subunit
MNYSEADTRANFIDPALAENNWKREYIRREHYISYTEDGKKLRGYVDYLLVVNQVFLAIIEAKRESKSPSAGLQKAIFYAGKLNVRFVFATNGKKIYQFDLVTNKGNYIQRLPTPDELLLRSNEAHVPLKEALLTLPEAEAFLCPAVWQACLAKRR